MEKEDFVAWHDSLKASKHPVLLISEATGTMQKDVYNALYMILRNTENMFKLFQPELGIIQITVDDPAIRENLLDILVFDLNHVLGFRGTKWVMANGRRIIHIPVPY